jgi:hypothetical protein
MLKRVEKMKARTAVLTVLLFCAALLTGDGVHTAPRVTRGAPRGSERIRFQITAVEENAGERHIVSEATVEGPPGTDFNINLQGGRFRMRARFLTDLVSPDSLKLRARLETRRLYGYSESSLPLYEEDEQSHTLELGFDEAVVLLPFGRGGGRRLKIEITPAMSERTSGLPSGRTRPPEIRIAKPSPGGIISIEATKIPHNFTVEATLLEDGREVARSAADHLLEEAREIVLRPIGAAHAEVANSPLAVNFTIERYARGRPSDQIAVRFDVHRAAPGQGGKRDPIALNWAGVANIGSDLTYDLSDSYSESSGKKYELRFKIKLAEGEQADY